MRRVSSLLLSLAAMAGACGDNGGAILVLNGVPTTATKVEIVLASATRIDRGIEQRSSPLQMTTESVAYYRQRASGGVIDVDGMIHGLSVKIEPEETVADDATLIPFVLVRDGSGALIAVGSVDDGDGAPMAITVRETASVRYALAITPVMDPRGQALTANTGLEVACTARDGRVFTSGIAWRRETDLQRRLLLADRSDNAAATDASDREMDLDCDQHVASKDDDCDDLRDGVHPGQTPVCDGRDLDCSGRPAVVEGCMVGGSSCADPHGVQLCASPTTPAPVCVPNTACACAAVGGALCKARCIVAQDTSSAMNLELCAPAVGLLVLDFCGGTNCIIDVAAVEGPITAAVGSALTGPFAATAAPTPSGQLYLRVAVQANVGPPIGPMVQSFGSVYLSVLKGTTRTLVGVDIARDPSMLGGCENVDSSSDRVMTCM